MVAVDKVDDGGEGMEVRVEVPVVDARTRVRVIVRVEVEVRVVVVVAEDSSMAAEVRERRWRRVVRRGRVRRIFVRLVFLF